MQHKNTMNIHIFLQETSIKCTFLRSSSRDGCRSADLVRSGDLVLSVVNPKIKVEIPSGKLT